MHAKIGLYIGDDTQTWPLSHFSAQNFGRSNGEVGALDVLLKNTFIFDVDHKNARWNIENRHKQHHSFINRIAI